MNEITVQISVILATYRRPALLDKTLESFCRMKTGELRWELLVMDNADDQETKTTADRFSARLPIRYIVEKRRGKNNALNRAVGLAGGDLLVFTDDDVLADQSWLVELLRGSDRWRDYSIFGGRILPHWPDGQRPAENIRKDFYFSAYAIAEWDISEGPYDAGKVWGGNMAIKKSLFDKGYCFSMDMDVKGENFIMGNETELTKRLEKDGHPAVYLPNAYVYHQIRPEQMTKKWLYYRACKYGRADVYFEECEQVSQCFGIPRFILKKLVGLLARRVWAFLKGDGHERLRLGIEYWIMAGRAYQFHTGGTRPMTTTTEPKSE